MVRETCKAGCNPVEWHNLVTSSRGVLSIDKELGVLGLQCVREMAASAPRGPEPQDLAMRYVWTPQFCMLLTRNTVQQPVSFLLNALILTSS